MHGGFADASLWPVIEDLQAHNVPVLAPPNPLRDLAHNAEYIASYVNQIDGRVLLRRRLSASPTPTGKSHLVDGKKNNIVTVHAKGLTTGTSYPWHIHAFAAGVTDPCAPGRGSGTDRHPVTGAPIGRGVLTRKTPKPHPQGKQRGFEVH